MKKKLSILIAVVLLLAAVSGCGASASKAASSADMASQETKAVAPESWNYGFDSTAVEKTEEYELPMEEAGNGGGAQQNGTALANAKLIYTAYLSMQTTEFDTTVQKLEQLVSSLGGYFESSGLNSYGTYRSASYTVRIPAESFDSFCTQAGELCQLLNRERYAEDISESYYDTESRLTTQQTKLRRLQELLESAENMEDIITIESAISETELNIERLTGTLRKYDSLVGYSTVNIELSEVYKLADVEQPVIGFGAKLGEAFKKGCSNFVDGVQSLALSFAYDWIGWLIFIAIAAAVIILARRLWIRKKRKKDDGDK